jgi:alkanesulfonate monooxygenase SsuD/methylene tetrahydromethanopterin reductase-like flavin-dependent oxidoreductase (luciferase family)
MPDTPPTAERGFGVAAGLDPDVAAELARRCEDLGYRSMWSNDHPGASGLGTAALFHEAARSLQVGVAVLALDRHDPESIAAKADEEGLDPGRLWVGIGAGFTKRPLEIVRQGLAELRRVLPASAQIAVAAMGPKMCALAGAEADGVFLNWPTPGWAAWARERVHEGAREAGRQVLPTIFAYVRVAVGDDAAERLHKEESFYRQLHQGYIRHFEAIGVEPGTVGIAARNPADVPKLLAPYGQAIDHVVVRALASANVEALGAVAEAAAQGSGVL